MEVLIGILESVFGSHVDVEQAAKFAVRAAPIVADLTDGDLHLSPENRLALQEIALDIREGK